MASSLDIPTFIVAFKKHASNSQIIKSFMFHQGSSTTILSAIITMEHIERTSANMTGKKQKGKDSALAILDTRKVTLENYWSQILSPNISRSRIHVMNMKVMQLQTSIQVRNS